MKTPHPHAELLLAIADGGLDACDQFECRRFSLLLTDPWYDNPFDLFNGIIASPDLWQVRRKPRTIKIGDVEVVAGITEAPDIGTLVYTASSSPPECFWFDAWVPNVATLTGLQRGLIHLSREPAEAMGKALAALTEHKNG